MSCYIEVKNSNLIIKRENFKNIVKACQELSKINERLEKLENVKEVKSTKKNSKTLSPLTTIFCSISISNVSRYENLRICFSKYF